VPDNSAPQPGVGNGGSGGSQPAGGNGVNVPDNSAPQPGVGDGGSSQPAPSGAPEVPSGDVPTSDLPAGDTPTAPPTDAPSTEAPGTDAPGTEAPGTDAPASADPGTGESPSVDDILADVPSVDDILADAPSVDDILADVPSTDTIVDGAPTVDDIVADADAGTDPATDAPSQETSSPAPSSTEAPPAGGPDRDAFGIPVVDLPNLPDTLTADAPAAKPDGAAPAAAGGPTGAGAVAAGVSSSNTPDAGTFSQDGLPPANAAATTDSPAVEGESPAAPDAEAPGADAPAGEGPAAAGTSEGESPAADDGEVATPNVPPHSNLSAPPLHQAADAPSLPRTELDAINAEYRLPTGEVDPARLTDWAEAVSEAYPALRPEEVLGIYDYTTNAGYEMIGYLRGDASTPVDAAVEARIDAASQGLANLPAEPSYGSSAVRPESFYHRGVALDGAFLAQFQVGARWSDPSFMSATNDAGVADVFVRSEMAEGKEPGIITIDALTPADVAPLSRYTTESEFLFQRGTEFEVVSRMQDGDGVWRIHLRELERQIR